jgi:uncharacterized protein (TIGR00255 family)
MSVVSMTGFARAEGTAAGARWTWEIKTVNGKGLDMRLRLAPGYDAIEPAARTAIQSACARGSVSATLTVKREEQAPTVRVNQTVLDAVIDAMAQAGRRIDAAAPRLDGLFAIRGVLETQEHEETDEDRATLAAAALAGLDRALADCVAMRRNEGAALARVLVERLDEIAALTREAENNPARSPAAIRTRLETQIATLMETARGLDPDRLHQEALLIAAKVDIREEIDRLDAHVAASRALLTAGGPIGRKLDFLAQEFNREVNTLCSKSNDVSLTATGIALKTVIEQFREQVQNIE